MGSMKILVLIAFAVISHQLPGNVLELDDYTFEHLTQAGTGATTGDWLIFFYKEGCGNCARFTSEWEKFANVFVEINDLPVSIAQVNIDNGKETMERFGISRHPTILYFRLGYYYTVSEANTSETLLKVVQEQKYLEFPKAKVPPPPGAILSLKKLFANIPIYMHCIWISLAIVLFSLYFRKKVKSS